MNRSKKITKALLWLGIILIALSILIVVAATVNQKIAATKNTDILKQMDSLLPEIRGGVYDDRVDMNMPTIEIDGVDFCAIVEVPARSVRLPVCAKYEGGPLSRFPCINTGSIYDGSLVISGNGYPGQFDFSKTISIGDSVFVTDMTGARYAYIVTWAEFKSKISNEYFASLEADLILLVRNTYSLDYTVIQCSRLS